MHFLKHLAKVNGPLVFVGLLMVPLLLLNLAGLVIDPRLVTGASVWLKPAKFATSTILYCLTLAWILSTMSPLPRLIRWCGDLSAWVLLLELALINLQAWRGVASHFNIGTPADRAVFSTMGVAIALLWAAGIAITVQSFRRRFNDRALGWAIRLGLAITMLGAGTGGTMVTPTKAQIAVAKAGGGLALSGAHTVGGPDGGPGLPGTGWSTRHGDLRVPHFLGLHALQVLPLGLLLMRRIRRGSAGDESRLVLAAGASYLALFVILLLQARVGEPLTNPSVTTTAALGAWAFLTVAAVYNWRVTSPERQITA